jgi:hypothetical protein
MRQYRITASTPQEYARSDVDPSYAPQETEVARFMAAHDRAAQRQFKRLCTKHPEWYAPELLA